MGSYSHQCDICGHESFGGYNSCRNRHCPTCGGPTRARWLDRVRQDVLPVVYFHFVFTLPDRVSALVRVNEERLYNLLFRTAWRTLKQLAKDPKHLGGEPGAIMVLHTWNQQLGRHPHVHCVLPGGVLSPTESWISAPISQRTGKPYLLPVQVVSSLFRGKFLAGLKRLHRKGELELPTELAHLSNDRVWNQFLTPMYRQKWVIYGEGPPQGRLGSGPDAILKYLARYVAGVAISDRRLIADDGENITFWAREPNKPGSRSKPKQVPFSLPGRKFVERFLMHVMPRGFKRVRYYGLLSNRHRHSKLAKVRALLDNTRDAEEESPSVGDVQELPVCPRCGMGVLQVIRSEDTPPGWVWVLLTSPYALRSDWDYWSDRFDMRPRGHGKPRLPPGKKAA